MGGVRQSGEVFSVAYDALVVALGSVTDFRAVPGMAEHAIGVRTLGDAFYLRNRALAQLEEAANEPDSARRDALLTFVVVGGGSTGVEVAAKLQGPAADRASDLRQPPEAECRARPQPGVRPAGVRRSPRPVRDEEAGWRRGAGDPWSALARVEPDLVELDDGKVIATATVISTVGNAPNPALAGLAGVDGALDARGWILPDATFAVPGLERVWALGDCASIVDPGTGRPWPVMARSRRSEKARMRRACPGGDGRPASDRVRLQPAGHARVARQVPGVGEVEGIKVSGFIAWFLWRGYYLLQLPSLERRIRVAFDWALELFLAHDVIEINMRRTRTRPGESSARWRASPSRWCPPGCFRRDRDLRRLGRLRTQSTRLPSRVLTGRWRDHSLTEVLERTPGPRLDRPQRPAQPRGNLGLRQVSTVGERDHRALDRRE